MTNCKFQISRVIDLYYFLYEWIMGYLLFVHLIVPVVYNSRTLFNNAEIEKMSLSYLDMNFPISNNSADFRRFSASFLVNG